MSFPCLPEKMHKSVNKDETWKIPLLAEPQPATATCKYLDTPSISVLKYKRRRVIKMTICKKNSVANFLTIYYTFLKVLFKYRSVQIWDREKKKPHVGS